MDTVDKIIAWESGYMDGPQMLEFFSELIKSGLINELQGSYQRAANMLVARGLLTAQGEITEAGKELG